MKSWILLVLLRREVAVASWICASCCNKWEGLYITPFQPLELHKELHEQEIETKEVSRDVQRKNQENWVSLFSKWTKISCIHW